jgi:hypothetical protein
LQTHIATDASDSGYDLTLLRGSITWSRGFERGLIWTLKITWIYWRDQKEEASHLRMITSIRIVTRTYTHARNSVPIGTTAERTSEKESDYL